MKYNAHIYCKACF